MDSDSSILSMQTLFDTFNILLPFLQYQLYYYFYKICRVLFFLHYSNKQYDVIYISCIKFIEASSFVALLQLEDVEVSIADHTQKVIKPNFAASWEEIGEGNELEDTYSLSMKTVEGLFRWFAFDLLPHLQQVTSVLHVLKYFSPMLLLLLFA